MIATFIALIFCTAILVFFSQEWVGLVKKLLAVRGMSLLLPLLLATTLILLYETVVVESFYIIQLVMNVLIGLLADIIPMGSYSTKIAQIILLMLLTVVPIQALHHWKKKKNYTGLKHPYLLCGLLWLFFAFLLTLQLPDMLANG